VAVNTIPATLLSAQAATLGTDFATAPRGPAPPHDMPAMKP
jgi:hypothetical protein